MNTIILAAPCVGPVFGAAATMPRPAARRPQCRIGRL
jgi:hypothetical protein